MNRPLFVSLDGPKGTGKTTLLEAVTKALRADNKKVIRLCEKKSDPGRAETMTLVNAFARNPTRDLELRVCERFADSRAWISRHVLTKQPPDSIILIDRWYPSDAAFRRILPFAEILQLNIDRNVRVPDLHVGIVTAPGVSWARAAARGRGRRAGGESIWLICRRSGARRCWSGTSVAGAVLTRRVMWARSPKRSRPSLLPVLG